MGGLHQSTGRTRSSGLMPTEAVDLVAHVILAPILVRMRQLFKKVLQTCRLSLSRSRPSHRNSQCGGLGWSAKTPATAKPHQDIKEKNPTIRNPASKPWRSLDRSLFNAERSIMYDRRNSAQLDRTTHRETSQEPFLPAERGGGGQQLVDETHLYSQNLIFT